MPHKSKVLPPEIGQLTHLNELDVSTNDLDSLPPEIGRLTHLKGLWVCYTKIKTLPPEIGGLVALRTLDVSVNKLEFLPPELGQLFKLEELFVNQNAELKELPMSLSNLPDLTEIDVDGTSIAEEIIENILELCRLKRANQAEEMLPKHLELWSKIADRSICVTTEKAGLTQIEIVNLYEWLIRLERAQDFKYHQKALAESVCGIIEHALTNKEFRLTFFSQVSANLECCQDRAAMALNEIYTSYRLSQIGSVSPEEKMKVILGCAKTNALRSEIAKRIEKFQIENKAIEHESVQIFLFYEKELAVQLQLETAIKKIAYEDIGRRQWITTEELIKAVDDTYLDILVEIPAFNELLKNDKNHNQYFSEKISPIEKKMYLLNERLPESTNELSEEYLLWQTDMNLLQQEYDKEARQLKKSWAMELLDSKNIRVIPVKKSKEEL